MLRHLEGFETRQEFTYLTRLYNSTVTTGAVTAFVEGRKLGSAAQAVNCFIQTMPLVSAPENTWIVGFGYRMSQTAATSMTIRDASGTGQLNLLWSAGTTANTFVIAVRRGSTVLATSGEFRMGCWHFFELKATIRTGTDGAYELKHNGTTVLSATGVNTADTAVDGASVVSFNWGGGQSSFDDIYICDDTGGVFDDFLGDKAIVGALPSGAGASTQWLPSTGTNVQCVDDSATTPANDFISSNVLNDLDLFEFGNLSTVAADGQVDAVALFVSGEMLNSGGRGLKVRFRNSGATTGDSDQFDVTLKGATRTFPVIFVEDPAAVSGWTKSAFDDGQFGVLNFAEL